jgi:hypothetical protein
MSTTTSTEFAGVMVTGPRLPGGDHVKVRRDTLRRIIATGKVTIIRTTHELDDTGEKAAPLTMTAAEFLPELAEPPVVSYLDMKTRIIRYCPSRCVGYNIVVAAN